MIAHAIHTGAPWEVLYRVHNVQRGRGGTGYPLPIVEELVIARSVRTGRVSSFLPKSLGLDPTQGQPWTDLLASIGMAGDKLRHEVSRDEAVAMACGRTCDTCPASTWCESHDPEDADIDPAEVALQMESGTGYLSDLS